MAANTSMTVTHSPSIIRKCIVQDSGGKPLDQTHYLLASLTTPHKLDGDQVDRLRALNLEVGQMPMIGGTNLVVLFHPKASDPPPIMQVYDALQSPHVRDALVRRPA